MEEKKTNTYKIKRETNPVSQKAKDNLKHFNALKKSILEAIGEEEVSVKQVAEKIKKAINMVQSTLTHATIVVLVLLFVLCRTKMIRFREKWFASVLPA